MDKGPRGAWLWLWADSLNPDQALVDSLLCHAVEHRMDSSGGTCLSFSASAIIRKASTLS